MSDLSAVSTLSIAEAAGLSHVSTRTVRRWISRGHVVTVVQGRERRVSAASLSEYLDTLGHPGQAPVDTSDTHADNVDTSDSADTDNVDTSDSADIRDTEAVHLAALVRQLVAENHQLAATAAIWQERARVLDERLALAPPVSPPGSNLTRYGRLWPYGATLLAIAAVLVLAIR